MKSLGVFFRYYGLTTFVVLQAIVIAGYLWWLQQQNPWTRDAQVGADVVTLLAPMNGTVRKTYIASNQLVQQTAPLLEFDNSHLSLRQQTLLQQQQLADDRVERLHQLHITAKRHLEEILQQTQAKTTLAEKDSIHRQLQNAQQALQAAQQSLNQARQKRLVVRNQLTENYHALSHTLLQAPLAGVITGNPPRPGQYVKAGQPLFSIIDTQSFRINAFFKETELERIEIGMPATVTLLAYPDQSLTGKVAAIGRGIARANGELAADQLPQVNPSFDWIRLAQRVPVTVSLDKVPEAWQLVVGTTASVVLHDR